MRRRARLGIALIAVGVAVALVSALADALFGGPTVGGFGWKQVTGVIVGVAAVAVGLALTVAARRTRS